MNNFNLSQELLTIVDKAITYATECKSHDVYEEHLLKALLDTRISSFNLAPALVNQLGMDVDKIVEELGNHCENQLSKTSVKGHIPTLSHSLQKILYSIPLEAKLLSSVSPNEGHMLLCLLKNPTKFISLIEQDLEEKFNYTDVVEFFNKRQEEDESGDTPVEDNIFVGMATGDEEEDVDPTTISNKKQEKPKTPALDKFTFDLTDRAKKGKLDPIIGRFTEVERVVQVLSRKKKNNPVLIGEPGVGKTAIAEGLALRIIANEVPPILTDKRLVSLDLTGLVAGTKFRGEFEERIKAILRELTDNQDIIMFIDEIHTIVGAGNSSGQMDAANILKPALARGEIQCIGATTINEYRESIEKDGALERRFQKVPVFATSPEDTLTILKNLRESYGEHHNVNYTDDALEACVDFSIRYLTDRHLPDKAIDLLDESGSRVNIKMMKNPIGLDKIEEELEYNIKEKDKSVSEQQFEAAAKFRQQETILLERKNTLLEKWKEERKNTPNIVEDQNVAEVISSMTGVPVTKITTEETEELKKLSSNLKSNLIGQDSAIDSVVRAIKRSRLGFSDPTKPIGCFIFSGATGVGKTELAKQLAKNIFDSEESLIRIDMSEFADRHDISKLIGSAPGFVGYGEGGRLTEAVRKKPYSIVLLDEIEKAHKDIYNTFLQVFDDGRLTDGSGRTVDFRNTILIMTSNVGSRKAQEAGDGVGFNSSIKGKQQDQMRQSILDKALRKQFSPEFLNRLDGVVKFNYLTQADVKKILHLELKKVKKRIVKLGYTVDFTDKALDFLSKKGFKKEFGARPLKRAIQQYVEDLLVNEILDKDLKKNSTLTITNKGKNDFLSVK